MAFDSGNLFDPLPDDSSQEVLETLLQNESISIERIVSFGQVTPEEEWYDQETDEWVLLAQGQSKLLYENGEERSLNAGDYVFIPRHKRHRVTYTSQDAIWLAIHLK
ncbi:MAG: cupin domain-containing protein [Opitutales bacterium]|jgi:cupin 2 domain-containing protein|nr:cupin domain-containing protein [Opitutales bacterium]